MLAQFALIVFALCAVLSLVVDVGYARLTQAQMQTAADAAALEGLRQRDVATDPETQRRPAHNVVEWIFDDDAAAVAGSPSSYAADASAGAACTAARLVRPRPGSRAYERRADAIVRVEKDARIIAWPSGDDAPVEERAWGISLLRR